MQEVTAGEKKIAGKGGRKKQSSSINGRAIKRGGGVKVRAIKKKLTFFGTFFTKVPRFQRPLKKKLFFAASLKH